MSSDVWILNIKWAADWPRPEGWAIEGVYASAALCLKRIEQLSDLHGSMMLGYDYKAYQVIQ